MVPLYVATADAAYSRWPESGRAAQRSGEAAPGW